MKKISILSLVMVLCFLVSCSSSYTHPEHPHFVFEEADTKIIVVSDTHYLGETLFDPTRDFDGEFFASDGRTMNYNNRIMDELVRTVLEIKPDYFIITGDVSYNGAKASHEELASKLKTLREAGIQPLVIPGNHDINILASYDYSDMEYRMVPTVNKEEFESIYADAGYTGAIAYSPYSSSYIYETSNDEWLFMLDTSLSEYNEEEGFNLVGGYFEELDWLEEYLVKAKELHKTPICFSHHNLITHHPNFTFRYTIENANELIALYQKYDVKLHFSGHLHIQNIVEDQGIYDICSNSTIVFGNRYGELNIGKDGIGYESKPIDFSMDESTLREYTKHQFIAAYESKHAPKTEEDKLIHQINAYYFDGSLLDHPELFTKLLLQMVRRNEANEYFKYIVETRYNDNHHLYIDR